MNNDMRRDILDLPPSGGLTQQETSLCLEAVETLRNIGTELTRLERVSLRLSGLLQSDKVQTALRKGKVSATSTINPKINPALDHASKKASVSVVVTRAKKN